MRRLCLFCGHKPGRDGVHADAARALATLLVRQGIGVVTGGGGTGLMGVVADEVLARGGEVVGVIPEALMTRELAHAGIEDMRVVATMHERKQLMHDLSDGFVALPGGIGTLEELVESMTWMQLGIHGKPTGLLNVEGYYDALLALLDRMATEGFYPLESRATLLVDASPDGLVERFVAWRPPNVDGWVG